MLYWIAIVIIILLLPILNQYFTFYCVTSWGICWMGAVSSECRWIFAKGLAKSTLKSYQSGIRRYKAFCVKLSSPSNRRYSIGIRGLTGEGRCFLHFTESLFIRRYWPKFHTQRHSVVKWSHLTWMIWNKYLLCKIKSTVTKVWFLASCAIAYFAFSIAAK